MLENNKGKTEESIFKVKVNESINRMLDCVLASNGKICKNCSDVDICSFLTEAIFAYRQKYMGTYFSTN